MDNKYALHDDYRKTPSFNANFGRLQMGVFNRLIKLECFLRCRKPIAGVTRKVCSVPAFDGHKLNALVIAPVDCVKPAPVLVYYHGGAFAMTYASLHIRACEHYAKEAGCVVVMVRYRLTPAYPFPYGFNDCFSTLQWVIANAATLGVDPQRIVVGGDSAGGAMAAGIAQKAHDQNIPLRAQLLIYPVLDSDCKTQSATDFFDTPLWNAIGNRRMWRVYLKDSNGKPPEYASPAQRKNLTGLVPAYIDTAEFDPLHDEDIAYAQALQAQGVSVTLNETHGTIHGFEMAPKNVETLRAMKARVEFLREQFV